MDLVLGAKSAVLLTKYLGPRTKYLVVSAQYWVPGKGLSLPGPKDLVSNGVEVLVRYGTYPSTALV